MTREYTSHLCTFMGREANLKILLPYIETCLRIGAVDNYWFVDMTRKRSDHELIKREQTRLNEMFPGRVHMHNHEARGKMIDCEETIKNNSNDWGVFYSMLEQFGDDDIIAKCDDDTYYIDVETLRAAFDFRWKHQQPYLMHANAINNGITAYHQKKIKDIWSHEEVDMYPVGGLTGPLFSHPEIPCDHHRQFATDLIKDPENIEKYKLNDNIHFTNRVSINFIFMLGKDRHTLKNITRQDEYDTSCKYPQRENRPNMIIGDFTMAHHTYGVQEPRMEQEQTHVPYQQLSDKLNGPDVHYTHREINQQYNNVGTIQTTRGTYLTKSWVKNNSYCLQDPHTNLYISLEHHEVENANGKFLKSKWSSTLDFKHACVFNIDIDNENCLWINNSIQLIRHPDRLDKIKQAAMMGFTFFQGLYKKSKMSVTMTDDDQCTIKPVGKDYWLSAHKAGANIPLDHQSRKNLFWQQQPFTWRMIPVHGHHDHVIDTTIVRPDEFTRYTNDETHATCNLPTLPDNHAPKDYVWSVKDYVWEFIKLDNGNHYIKLVADDQPEMFLTKLGNDMIGVGQPDEWIVENQHIKHVQTGMYIHVNEQTSQVMLSQQGTELNTTHES